MKVLNTLFICGLFVFLGCSRAKKEQEKPILMSLQLIDRNGFNETISAKDRLDQYQSTDFFTPQPYKKVVQVYQRNSQGKVKSKVTSYHDNGQIWQCLDIMDGRACGDYSEWYPSGKIRIEAKVIEGMGDLTLECMNSWVFDKKSKIYDEQGLLLSEFNYEKGELEGPSYHYYSSGKIFKSSFYHKNLEEGDELCFSQDGKVIGKRAFVHGYLEGESFFEGNYDYPRYEEVYEKGLLLEGSYYDFEKNKISSIEKGAGIRTRFRQGACYSKEEFKNGAQEGEIVTYYPSGHVHTKHIEVRGEKHGEEWIFYPPFMVDNFEKAKLCLTWYKSKLQGKIKSWYTSGALESEREFYDNKKNGPASAFYNDGQLMFIEEYEQDRLVKGLYQRKGDKEPVSYVENGDGVATVYDGEGVFVKKVIYKKGVPVDE